MNLKEVEYRGQHLNIIALQKILTGYQDITGVW